MKFKVNNRIFLKYIFLIYILLTLFGVITFILGYYDIGFQILYLTLIGMTITKYLSNLNIIKVNKEKRDD